MNDRLSLESATAILAQADAARKSDDFKAAARFYNEIGTQSDNKELVTASADGLQACGEDATAIAVLEGALDRWPESTMLLMRAANACDRTGNYAGAAQYLRKITEFAPGKSRYWVRLGAAYRAAGNWQEAEAAFTRALTIAPLDPSAAMGRGDALAQQGRIEEAIVCYRRLVTLTPDHADATLKLGNLLSLVGNFGEAISVLRRAITHNPKNAAVHLSLGCALHYHGSEEEGLALCQEAIDLEPNLPGASETIGILLLDSGRIAEARETLAPLGREGASVPGLIAMYTVACLSEDMEAAERALHRVLTLDPQHGEARHLLAAMHGEPVARPTSGYVENLFSRLANRYDQRMVEGLRYRMPQYIASEISNARSEAKNFSRWLDLGCGTGLVAIALDDAFEIGEKIGVDITQEMLNRAGRTGLYHQLIHGDVTDALGEFDGIFDLITAVDLLPYMGDLKEFLPRVAARMALDGLFIYTHELTVDGTYKLGPSGRFAHSADYLEKLTSSTNMKAVATKPATLRYDKGEEAPGRIVVVSMRD